MNISADLRPYFDGGTDMYLQVTPTDVYFVVPKKIGTHVFGDHYRLHHVPTLVPQYDSSKTYNNLIDIHRTNMFYDTTSTSYRTRHEPKCMFHNGTKAPIINNNIELNSVVCFNKVQKGNHHMGRVFSDKTEYTIVSELLQMPFQDEINRRRSAANKIKRAWLAKGGSKRYLNTMPNESIDHIHIVYVRQRPSWHLTAIAYDSNGHPVADCSFVVNRLLWKSVEEKLKKGLGI